LVPALREKFGKEHVIACGRKTSPSDKLLEGPFEYVDVCDKEKLEALVKKYKVDTIYHLASLLSASSEDNPELAWDINLMSLKNVLDIARDLKLSKVFWPSSIGAFGPTTPKLHTPQHTILEPTSLYGVTKVAGEHLCNYYSRKWKVDIRGIRYPGIISSETLPGGGTTDYAVAIFYDAIKHKKYQCYLREDTQLPMMYMPDAVKAALDLMDAPAERLSTRMSYNLTAFSFSPTELSKEITNKMPEFKITYAIDPVRQGIADSWPDIVDDSAARKDWGWTPKWSMTAMIDDMLKQISKKLNNP